MARTLQSVVHGLERHGGRPAIVARIGDGAESWSYRRLHDETRRRAGWLAARGLGRGSPTAVLATNGVPLVVLRLALIAAGVTAVPLDDQGSPDELERELADSGARVLFATRDLLPRVPAVAQRRLDGVYLLEDQGLPEAPGWGRADAPAALSPCRPEDAAALIYTSGTTGAAKGAPLTHGNVMATVDALAEGGFIGPGDRVLLPLPLHHAYPFLVGLMLPLVCGSAVILPRSVTGPDIADALRSERATAMIGVPRIYEAMADGIEARLAGGGVMGRLVFRPLLRACIAVRRRFGLRAGKVLMAPVRRRFAPRLRMLGSGGARLDPRAAWVLEGLGFEVLSGYGLVETSSVTAFNRRGRGRIGTEGLPAPGAELRIRSPGTDGVGEIEIRGPHVFAGYLGDPQATAEAFTADGWFRSGDLGRLDRAGSLIVTGRRKEVLVLSGGKNVGPEEVETALCASPYIDEAAVLERNGALHALIVPDEAALRATGTVRLDDVMRVAAAESCIDLAPYKRVTGFRLWREPLPRTRLGKLRRFSLPALYEAAGRAGPVRGGAAPEADRALLADPMARAVVGLLERRFADAGVDLDTSPQLDLGVDSLAWLEIVQQIEAETGVALPGDSLGEVVTLRDLVGLVRDAARAPSAAIAAAAPPATALREPHGATRAAGYAIHLVVRLLCRGLFRMRSEGAPPSGRDPVLFVVNHASDLDAFMVAAAMPWRVVRRTWWSAETTRVSSTPLHRWFTRAARIFPIDDAKPAESLALGDRALASGANLVWFPEAWRTPDGRLQPFTRGVGVLAGDRATPICPVWVAGTFEALPRHRRWPRLRPVRVIFGPPVAARDVAAPRGTDDRAAATAAAIRAHVAALDPARDPPSESGP